MLMEISDWFRDTWMIKLAKETQSNWTVNLLQSESVRLANRIQ